MATNLRVGFHERQQKRLNKAIKDVESIHFHGLKETVTISGDNSMPSVQTLLIALVDVPSREELDILLERFPIFTNMDPPMTSDETIEVIMRLKVGVRNMMRHRSHFFERLKVVEKIRELLAKIEMAKIAKGAAWKAVVEGIELSKAKAKEESAWLKQKLERTMSGLAKEKKELEVAYQ
ncbi:hypothetical protein AAG906_027315 [Vitis piasezkii]